MDERERCECRTGSPRAERWCPAHRYRWEYQQDEDAAHKVLDELGAPRVAGPYPNDAILSVAGRIRVMALTDPEDVARARRVEVRVNPRPLPRRCALLGHKWGRYVGGKFRQPSGLQPLSTIVSLVCKRCGARPGLRERGRV